MSRQIFVRVIGDDPHELYKIHWEILMKVGVCILLVFIMSERRIQLGSSFFSLSLVNVTCLSSICIFNTQHVSWLLTDAKKKVGIPSVLRI